MAVQSVTQAGAGPGWVAEAVPEVQFVYIALARDARQVEEAEGSEDTAYGHHNLSYFATIVAKYDRS